MPEFAIHLPGVAAEWNACPAVASRSALRLIAGIILLGLSGRAGGQVPSHDSVQRLPVMDKHDIRFAPLLVGGEPFKKRVLAIAQDNYGFMWLGTDEGLYRYDGYALRPYRHDPKDPRSLSDNTVFVAYKDRDGILWIGTGYGGLDRFDPAQDAFTHYRHDPNDSRSLRIGQVFSICQDRAGSI